MLKRNTFLLILLILSMLISLDHSEARALKEDTEIIFDISKPYLQGGYNLILKWSGTIAGYESEADLSKYYHQLCERFGMPSNGALESLNGLPVLRASSPLTQGAQLQAMLVGSKDQKTSFFLLKLSANDQVTIEQIRHWQTELEHKLVLLGLKGTWNTMIQGAINDTELRVQPELLLQTLSEKMQGQEQESYEDGNTISVSFLSKKLQASIQSGNHPVNVQIALHQDSITKAWRLTIGTPLITGEY
jgi:hypothetical protein